MMRRDGPVARQLPDGHDSQHDQGRDDGQAAWPPAGRTVRALTDDVIHDPHRLGPQLSGKTILRLAGRY
jgi:hypothetical protein